MEIVALVAAFVIVVLAAALIDAREARRRKPPAHFDGDLFERTGGFPRSRR